MVVCYASLRATHGEGILSMNKGTHEHYLAYHVIYLAGGFYAWVFAYLGDSDKFSAFFGTARPSETCPCTWCPATNRDGIMPWSDFRTAPAASWMSNMFSAPQWLMDHPIRHALLSLPGMSVLSLASDWMHVKYLGCDQYVLASVLYLLTHMLLPGCRFPSVTGIPLGQTNKQRVAFAMPSMTLPPNGSLHLDTHM